MILPSKDGLNWRAESRNDNNLKYGTISWMIGRRLFPFLFKPARATRPDSNVPKSIDEPIAPFPDFFFLITKINLSKIMLSTNSFIDLKIRLQPNEK